MPFSSLGLSAALRQALADMKFERPYPIQEQAIPAVLMGKDLFGIAPTGSGKTASYVLPLLTKLSKEQQERNRNIRALIVVPTRELAMQVQQVIYHFSNRLPERISSMAVYGGVSINPQMKALMGTSILVATPGRLLELIDSNAVQRSEEHTSELQSQSNLVFRLLL